MSLPTLIAIAAAVLGTCGLLVTGHSIVDIIALRRAGSTMGGQMLASLLIVQLANIAVIAMAILVASTQPANIDASLAPATEVRS